MRILLADDERKVRSALRLLLEQQSEMAVVGEAEDWADLLHKADCTHPDLVLLDWELPGDAQSEYIQQLRFALPGLSLVAMSGRPEARQAALCAQADGFISKVDPPEQVLDVLNAIRQKRGSQCNGANHD